MDLRGADPATQQREIIDRAMGRMNTCLPGVIESFNTTTQTVTVTPAIQMKVIKDDTTSYVSLPVLVNVPIVFPFASVSGFALTLPVQKGDSCLLVFSQRAIDNWHNNGGVQPPENGVGTRHHALTDAFAILAPSNIPIALSSWCTDGVEIRNKNGLSRITVKDNQIEVVFGTTLMVVSALGIEITGNLRVNGIISDSTITYSSHVHTDPQGGSTGAPL